MFDDFNELLLANTQAPDRRFGIDGDLEPVEQGASVAMHARPIDQAPAKRRGAV